MYYQMSSPMTHLLDATRRDIVESTWLFFYEYVNHSCYLQLPTKPNGKYGMVSTEVTDTLHKVI